MKFEREISTVNNYDVIVVGSGPAGIAAADTVGWTGSFILLTVIAAVSVIIALLYLVVDRKKVPYKR